MHVATFMAKYVYAEFQYSFTDLYPTVPGEELNVIADVSGCLLFVLIVLSYIHINILLLHW